MKKFMYSLMVSLFVLLAFKADAKADTIDKFNEAFLVDGQIEAPEGMYVKVYPFTETNHQYGKYWASQSESVLNLIREWDLLGEEAFNETYGFKLYDVHIQYDVKLDDGEWHYQPGWDEYNYDDSNLPDYMALYCTTPACFEEKVLSQGYNIDLCYMDDEGSNWGFFKDIVKTKDGNRYLDLDHHTLTIRPRYIVEFMAYSEETQNDEYYTLCSDWGPETSVGKEGSQKEIAVPEKLEAPRLLKLSFIEGKKTDDSSSSLWYVYIDVPSSVFDAELYYWTDGDGFFEPIGVNAQYRVNEGEWIDTCVANAGSICGGKCIFTLDNCSENDTIELRAMFENRAEEDKTSDWSNIVSNKEGVGTPVPDSPSTNVESEKPLEESVVTASGECKLCGICPIQPKGLCLFIWILLILLIASIIVFFIRKIMKKLGKDTKKITLVFVLLIVAFVLILALWIYLIIKHHQ